MNKLQKAWKILTNILQKPSLLNLVLLDNDNWKEKVTSEHNLPNGLPVVDFTTLVPPSLQLDYYTSLEGGSLLTDLALLKGLASSIPNCNYFEIGTWRGESVANVASVAAECFTLNIEAKELNFITDKNIYNQQIGFHSKHLTNVKHLTGNSLTYNYASINKKMDLVFIDGDHHYDSIKKDTTNILQNIIHDDSIIVWHDYAFSPEMIRYEVLAAILDSIPKEKHGYLYHVSNTMCAVYIPKKMDTYPLQQISTPRHTFSIHLKTK